MLFIYGSGQQQINGNKKCRQINGNFDCHGDGSASNLFLLPLNRSPVVGNDSQNGIHCCWRASIIYELTKDIVTNDIVAQLYF